MPTFIVLRDSRRSEEAHRVGDPRRADRGERLGVRHAGLRAEPAIARLAPLEEVGRRERGLRLLARGIVQLRREAADRGALLLVDRADVDDERRRVLLVL